MSGRAVGNRLAIAEARAQAARARLSSTIGALQERARPTSLVQDVTETLKDHGADLALGLIGTAKRRPVRTGAVIALVGLFLARHRLIRLFRSAATPSPSTSPERGSPR